MLNLTEISILKSRSGVYQDTPENRRLHRVGMRYGAEKKQETDVDIWLKRRKAQKELSDKQYRKAQELVDALKKRGLNDFYINRSITDFGVSTYVMGEGEKYRISDHSVTSNRRIMEEGFFDFNTDVEKLADNIKKDVDRKSERARERYKEFERRKSEEQELDSYWDTIKDKFKGKTFHENKRTYDKPDEFAKKHPDWDFIFAESLGSGAYAYEWVRDANGYGKQKPSYKWLRWYKDKNS